MCIARAEAPTSGTRGSSGLHGIKCAKTRGESQTESRRATLSSIPWRVFRIYHNWVGGVTLGAEVAWLATLMARCLSQGANRSAACFGLSFRNQSVRPGESESRQVGASRR